MDSTFSILLCHKLCIEKRPHNSAPMVVNRQSSNLDSACLVERTHTTNLKYLVFNRRYWESNV